jgi:hypothetical protein
MKVKGILLRLCILPAVGALVAISGCSTIVEGKTQTVSINSNVKDADITINGMVAGRTPFTGLIKRGNHTTVTLAKEGYQSKTVTLDSSLEPWFWGNIILGGLLGSTTDASTGAMYKYAPSTVEIDLEPVAAGK